MCFRVPIHLFRWTQSLYTPHTSTLLLYAILQSLNKGPIYIMVLLKTARWNCYNCKHDFMCFYCISVDKNPPFHVKSHINIAGRPQKYYEGSVAVIMCSDILSTTNIYNCMSRDECEKPVFVFFMAPGNLLA